MSIVTPEAAAIEPTRSYTVTVTVQGGGDALLRLVSVFHRRQVDILHVTYSRVSELQWLVASVETTEARLRTLAMTLRNTVGVTGHEVVPGIRESSEGGDTVAALPPRRPTKTPRQELV